MKFFKALFGGGAEKYEDKADELRLDFEYRDAAYYYRQALEALGEEPGEATDRLKKKLREVRRQAFAQLLEEATELIKQESPEAAQEKLEIAENFADDDYARVELSRRREELGDLFGAEPPEVETPETVSGVHEELLELALSGYSDEDKERATALGEPFRLAYQALQEERWDLARERLDALLEDHPEDPLVLELAGTAAEYQDDLDGAVGYLLRAQEAAPFRPDTVQGLLTVYRKQEQTAEVRNLLSRAVTHQPVHANLPEHWTQIHLEYALALSEDGHHDAAASTILALTGVRQADRAFLFFNLAGVLERAGREEDARSALERAVEAAPRKPIYKERLADFLVQHRIELDTALGLLVSANEVETTAGAGMFGGGGGKATESPNRARYLYKMARVYFLKGEDEEADRIVTTGLAVAREPEVVEALQTLQAEIRAGEAAADRPPA